ncbi:MAG TPA: RHS repeat-associated core domain-containing protein [Pseudobacteroides sp.]|uniref:RHS repeat-associated core domain-containing protein n=1 Tax=Pseudobacteroides sp. TaxID=1968840 RepID=UPI002F92BEA6
MNKIKNIISIFLILMFSAQIVPAFDLAAFTNLSTENKVYSVSDSLNNQNSKQSKSTPTNTPINTPSPYIKLELDKASEEVGGIINAKLMIDNIDKFAGYQVNIKYDPNVLQPVDSAGLSMTDKTEPQAGNILSSLSFAPITYVANNTTQGYLRFGKCYMDLKTYKSCNAPEKTGILATLSFKLLKKVETSISFENYSDTQVKGNRVDIFDWDGKIISSGYGIIQPQTINQGFKTIQDTTMKEVSQVMLEASAATMTNTPPPTSTSTAGIEKKVIIDGWVADDVCIKNPSLPTASKEKLNSNFKVQAISNGITMAETLTDVNGHYSLEFDASGYYLIQITKDGYSYFPRAYNLNLYGSFSIGSKNNPDNMYSGDLNHDGAVNMADNIMLAQVFNTVEGQPGYSIYLDLNADGAINMADTIILAGMFNVTVIYRQSIYLNSDCSIQTDTMTEFKNAYVDLNSRVLTVNGGFKVLSDDGKGSTLDINGGRLEVNGYFNFGESNSNDVLLMNSDESYIKVTNDFIYNSMSNDQNRLTAGTIELKRNFTINDNSSDYAFYATGTHKVLLTGTGTDKQKIQLDQPTGSKNRKINILMTTKQIGQYELIPLNCYNSRIYTQVNVDKRSFNNGQGVFIPTGNYSLTFSDMETFSPGIQFDISRSYNSMNYNKGSLGYGWTFNFDNSTINEISSSYVAPGKVYEVILPDGTIENFLETDIVDKEFASIDNRSTLNYIKYNQEYTLKTPEGISYYYDSGKKLYKIMDELQNSVTIETQTNKKIIRDSISKEFTVTYENGLVKTISDGDRTVGYAYETVNQVTLLKTITDPMLNVITLEYTNGLLTAVKNGNIVLEQIEYKDLTGKVDYTIDSLGKKLENDTHGKKQEYDYSISGQTTVTDKDNSTDSVLKKTTYYYNTYYAITKVEEKDASGNLLPDINTQIIEYNEEGIRSEVSGITDYNKNKTTYNRMLNGFVREVINSDNSTNALNLNDNNKVVITADDTNSYTLYDYDDNTHTKLLRKAQTYNKLASNLQKELRNILNMDLSISEYAAQGHLDNNLDDYAITQYDYYNDKTYDNVNNCPISGLVSQVTDPEGKITKFTYYPEGTLKEKILQAEDGSDLITTYTYNSMMLVASIKTPKGYVTEYQYDKNGNLVREIQKDELGNVKGTKRYSYDSLGRMAKEVLPNVYNISYDTNDGEYDPSNVSINKYLSYTYYPSGQIKTERLPDTDIKYTPNGNPIPGEQVITSYTYDKYGNIETKTLPNGAWYKYTYDLWGRLKNTYFKERATDSGDSKLISSYDYYLLPQENGLNYTKVIETSYIKTGKEVTHTTIYDFDGRVVESKLNSDEPVITTYYPNGQIASVKDAKGSITKYYYEKLNMLTKIEAPFETGYDSVTNYSYYKNGNLKTQETSINKPGELESTNKKQFNYNKRNLLSEVVIYNGTSNITSNYYYDADGNKDKIVQGEITTQYQYNYLGKPSKMIDTLGKVIDYDIYDKNGNLIHMKDRNGSDISYSYDNQGHVILEYAKGNVSGKDVVNMYHYNVLGLRDQMIVESNGSNTFVDYTYDQMGRLVNEKWTNTVKNYTVDKNYIHCGNSSNIETFNIIINNSTPSINTKYEYDANMRLQYVKENDILKAKYEYYADSGNRKKLTYYYYDPSLNTTYALNTIDYNYNLANKVKSIINKNSAGTVISSFSYGYYLDGAQASKTEVINNTTTTTDYEYDNARRLVKATEKVGATPNQTVIYKYDSSNNRSRMEVQGSTSYNVDYSYTDLTGKYTGRLLKETTTGSKNSIVDYAYDNNGNQITKKEGTTTTTNEYDALNRLIKSGTSTYAYDGDGLRISKTVGGVTTYQIWDGQNIALEIDSSYNLIKKYVRGINLIYNEDKNGYTQNYIFNGHSDVVQLTNKNAANNNVIRSYSYDAFGNEKNPDPTDTNVFRYCGEYFDKENGTIYLRARSYDPRIGRFVSEDSYAGEIDDPLSLNLYTYCQNNPVNYFDPSGHKVEGFQKLQLAWGFIKGGVGEVFANSGGVFQALSNIGALKELISDIIAGKVGWNELKQIGLDVVAGDIRYVVDNWNIISDNKSYSDSVVSSYGEHLAGAFAELVNIGAIVVGAAKSAGGITGKIKSIVKSKGARSKIKTNLGNEIDITPSSNHSTTTNNPGLKGAPNSSVDILDGNGNIKTRRWFGSEGTQTRDVDFTNHGNPKVHPEWPHEHGPR